MRVGLGECMILSAVWYKERARQTGAIRSSSDPFSLATLTKKLPDDLGFFQFVHNARRRGKALLGALVAALVV
jgi:hypothetical protein